MRPQRPMATMQTARNRPGEPVPILTSTRQYVPNYIIDAAGLEPERAGHMHAAAAIARAMPPANQASWERPRAGCGARWHTWGNLHTIRARWHHCLTTSAMPPWLQEWLRIY